jgi:hypothetical protein
VGIRDGFKLAHATRFQKLLAKASRERFVLYNPRVQKQWFIVAGSMSPSAFGFMPSSNSNTWLSQLEQAKPVGLPAGGMGMFAIPI